MFRLGSSCSVRFAVTRRDLSRFFGAAPIASLNASLRPAAGRTESNHRRSRNLVVFRELQLSFQVEYNIVMRA